jgi:uncharacterized protein
MNDFKQKYGTWAVVTGASDGIGQSIAVELATKGINLVLVARRQAKLEQHALELQQQYGIQTRVVAADLSLPAEIERVLTTTALLEVGLLVASAGFGTSGQLIRNSVQDELAMLDLNCRTVLAMTHHFAQRFATQKRGGIILFGSLVGFQGVARAANYAATKAYIQSLGEGLHIELAPLGVDVLVSAPGPVTTGFETRANMKPGNSATPQEVAKSTLAALGRKITVRPGVLAVMLELLLSPLPRWARTRIMTQIMAGMTRHQA